MSNLSRKKTEKDRIRSRLLTGLAALLCLASVAYYVSNTFDQGTRRERETGTQTRVAAGSTLDELVEGLSPVTTKTKLPVMKRSLFEYPPVRPAERNTRNTRGTSLTFGDTEDGVGR